MKILLIFSCFVIVVLDSLFLAQNQGKLEYIIEVEGATPQLQKTAQMLFDSRMNVLYRPNQSRVDFKLGEMMTQTMITNSETDQALSFSTGMMGDIAIVATMTQLQGSKVNDTASSVELIDETKEILGFKCKKAIVTTGAKEKITYWYTNDISLSSDGHQFMNPLVPGVPLEFTAMANGLLMHYKLANYSTEIPDAETQFSLVPPDGFQVLTFQQYQQMLLEQAKKQN